MTVDKSPERVQTLFGEIAPRYDFLNHLLSMGTDTYWRWRTVKAAPIEGSAPVLDLCTGTGDLAFAYHRAARGRAAVMGTDFCEPMLEVARRKQKRRGIDRGLEFLAADAQSLPFSDETFQLVTVAFGLRNIADTSRGLAEMVRVCRRGGRVVVLEFSMPRQRVLRAVYSWYFKHVLPRIGQALARNQQAAYNYLPASVGEFPAGEALAALMREAGLGEVRFRPLTFGVATLYIGTK